MEFVNLYIQTEYTMLGSTIKLEELIIKAKNENLNNLAICDTSNMHGAFKFYNLCIKNDIKPIIGLNIALESRAGFYNKFLLYVKNLVGYKNLLRIASEASRNEFVSIDFLSKHKEGILGIIPGYENEIVKLFLENSITTAKDLVVQYKDLVEDLYFGLDMQNELIRNNLYELIDFSKSNSIDVVGLNKTTFLEKEDYEVYEVLRCVSLGINSYPKTEHELAQYFISQAEAKKIFKVYPELIENTLIIANKCNLELNYQGYYFPTFAEAKGKSFHYLTDLCKLGLNKRLNGLDVDYELYKNRLLHELSIINEMGFSDYFLIVYDFVRYAKQNNILVGPGRGSAPGSLVAYCLGITDIDPIKYDLLFERFLNPERSTMPDIDIDFPDNKRDQVISYVVNKYGRDKVAHITTFGTYGPRLAIRDVVRALKLSDIVLNEILRYVNNNDKSIESVIEKDKMFRELTFSNEDVAKVVRVVKKMEGLPRHTSTHAAGIIMSSDSLVNYTPLQEGINGIYQTQFEANDLEQIGLIKMDLLGIRNLTIIDDVINKVRVENPNFRINDIPMDDFHTYKMIALGDTDGIFQLESPGMRNVLQKLKTSTFMDIVNANALYRPGPMEMIPSFVKRKFGQEKIDYIDNSLREILEPTFGTIVFQEQIMLIVQKFAGYSLGMADILRRAVSKKDAQILENERTRFVINSKKMNHEEEVANRVYDYIVKFANYGFNKSHSVAYSMIAYQMAYLKRHYYRFFMSTLMSNSLGSVELIRNYINDCKKKNVVVRLPSVNYSEAKFVVHNREIYYSLLGIQTLGALTLNNLLLERKENGLYKNYQDFVTRTKDILNKRVIENLIHAGALDEFNKPRKQMVLEYENCLNIAKYNELLGSSLLDREFSDEEYTFDEISSLEREALGFNFKYSLFIKFKPIKDKYKTNEILDLIIGRDIMVIFAIKYIREILTKNNDEMAFLSVYDDTGEIDVVVFPNTYSKLKNVLETNKVYLAKGNSEIRNDKKQFVLQNIKKLN